MTAVSIPLYARPALQTNRYIRNGLYPDALATTFMQEETNRILHQRMKSWSFFSPLDAIPSAGGGATLRARWRARIHTSSQHSYMFVRFVMASSRNATNPYSFVRFTVAGSGPSSGDATMYYGAQSASDPDTPKYFGVGNVPINDGSAVIELLPDTGYEIGFYDYDNARLVSATMWEIPKLPDTDNGYINSGVQAGSPIYDAQRAATIPALRTAWKRNAAPLITWSVNQDSEAATANGAAKNVVDTSITTVSTASPGFTVDGRYRSTVRRAASGVPCIMYAYLDGSGAATIGNLLLKDSSGTTLATCSLTGTTAGWVSSGAFYIPATLAKYDLMVSQTNIGTASAFAASVFQHEA